MTAGPHVLMAAFIKKNHAPIEDIVQQPSNTLLDPLVQRHSRGHVDRARRERHGRRAVRAHRPRHDAEPREDLHVRAGGGECRAGMCPRDPVEPRASRLPASPDRPSTSRSSWTSTARGRANGGDFDKGIETWPCNGSCRARNSCSASSATRPVLRPTSLMPSATRELASRLAFFLWSSIPDDELLDLAARNRLSRPAVLAQQVQRMLADPNARPR